MASSAARQRTEPPAATRILYKALKSDGYVCVRNASTPGFGNTLSIRKESIAPEAGPRIKPAPGISPSAVVAANLRVFPVLVWTMELTLFLNPPTIKAPA